MSIEENEQKNADWRSKNLSNNNSCTAVMDWVACKDKIPLDIENYLVYGDGQYTVTFYSVRRKEWNTDFEVTHYCKLPSPPCA